MTDVKRNSETRESGLTRLGELYMKLKDNKARLVVLALEDDDFSIGTFNVDIVTAVRMHAKAGEIILTEMCDILEAAKQN